MSTLIRGYEVVIGFETHTQLSTASKIFSGASTQFGAQPNTQASAVDLALPGTLPVLNRGAVERAIRLGLAVNATIAPLSIFARKNYFYPDLPKGYQISQYEIPVVQGGTVPFMHDGELRTLRLTRAHLEEDAGKSVHEGYAQHVGHRPEPRRHAAAGDRHRARHALVHRGGRLRQGAARAGDVAGHLRRQHAGRLVPLRRQRVGAPAPASRSARAARSRTSTASATCSRRSTTRSTGRSTRSRTAARSCRPRVLFDPDTGETRMMRTKEDAQDYRYFPDPDLPPLVISREWVEQVRAQMPELPRAMAERFVKADGLPEYDAAMMTQSLATARFYEAARDAGAPAKLVANWMMGEISRRLNSESLDIEDSPVDAALLAALIKRIQDGTISNNAARQVFEALWTREKGTRRQRR